MSEDSGSLLNLVNSSGFPFQLRIEHEVQTKFNAREHLWEILGGEHQWIDRESGEKGFIDIVLRQGIARMTIECKRVRDGTWIFLVPTQQANSTTRVRLIYSDNPLSKPSIMGWKDFDLKPDSMESAFCVVRGSGEKDVPMLERLSGIVLASLENLAIEEMVLMKKEQIEDDRIYIPVIVTNANLQVCVFDSSQVGLQDGQLNGASFGSVPYIRFRKSMITKLASLEEPKPTIQSAVQKVQRPHRILFDSNLEKERTVFVVQANNLLDFLNQCPG